MAKSKLTDKQKKRIIADYVETQNKRETARRNKVSPTTVARLIEQNGDTLQKVSQKKEENTADLLAYLDTTNADLIKFVGMYMRYLTDPEIIGAMAVKDIEKLTRVYGILIDKQLAVKQKSGGKADTSLMESLLDVLKGGDGNGSN